MTDSDQNKKEAVKFWKMTNTELFQYFNTNENGYTSEVAEKLAEKYGLNELKEEEKESIWEKILEQFQDNLVKILLVAAFVSFVIALTSDAEEGLTAYVEPFVILLILIANAAIGVIQDINADKAIEALKRMQATSCTVRRNGAFQTLDAKYLVPGDIVMLVEGERVPADARIFDVQTATFQVDQSSLTGETTPAYKIADPILEDECVIKVRHNTVFSSCGIITGTATGIVVGTGMETEIGGIMDMVEEGKGAEEKSPLKKKLEEFGDYLSYIIGIICLVVWVINYKNFFDESHSSWITGCIYYFKISVSLAVAAIPEGLPAVITTCLALGTSRMSAKKAIIRKLHSIETLGCTNIICSDKTGTLTTNNMTITKFFVFSDKSLSQGDFKSVSGSSFEPKGQIEGFSNGQYSGNPIYKLLNECSSLNNMSTLTNNNGSYSIIGTPTEGALRVFTEKCGQYDDEFARFANASSGSVTPYNDYLKSKYEVVYVLDFDRKRKAKSVIAINKETNKPVLFIKGAVEYLIENAATYESGKGFFSMNDSFRKELRGEITEQFMKKSLRTLALCVKEDLPELRNFDLRNKKELNAYFKEYSNILKIENNCTLLGVVGMLDPPRPGVRESIQVCHGAGIRVFMITGDEKETAKAIGMDIGLIDKETANDSCYYSADFFKLSESEQLELLKTHPKLVFARSEPKHKMDLIKLLQKLDFIVSMTGDGTNDAPALSRSNIGIAMGISGTEVAKEASHMVLADDNFSTIVNAIEEGRSIYMNMKAFIRYLISSNIGEVVSIFLSSMLGMPEAFTSIQLLWVNLVTDGPPATALSFNPTEKNIMTKPPRNK